MKKFVEVLESLSPFVMTIALLFGVIAAWHAVCELIPFARNIWAPRGSAQSMGLVGACLALIARGGKIT